MECMLRKEAVEELKTPSLPSLIEQKEMQRKPGKRKWERETTGGSGSGGASGKLGES